MVIFNQIIKYHNKCATFQLEVDGVNPRLVIVFDTNSEVVEILNPWRTFSEYKAYPIISKSEAISLLKNNDRSYTTVCGVELDDTITINSIEFAYFNEPIGYDMEYLLPYYHMIGTNKNGNRVEAYVRAISDEYVEIITTVNDTTENARNVKSEGEFDDNKYSNNTSKLTDPETEQEAAKNTN